MKRSALTSTFLMRPAPSDACLGYQGCVTESLSSKRRNELNLIDPIIARLLDQLLRFISRSIAVHIYQL